MKMFYVSFVIALFQFALKIKILRKNFSVFVNRSILNDRHALLHDLLLMIEPLGQKKHLKMKTPSAHIAIEVGEIRIRLYDFVVWLPSEALRKQSGQRRFSRSDVSCDGDELWFSV